MARAGSLTKPEWNGLPLVTQTDPRGALGLRHWRRQRVDSRNPPADRLQVRIPKSAIGSSGLTTAERGTFPLSRANRRFWKTLRTELHTPALHRQRGAASGSDTRKTHDEE